MSSKQAEKFKDKGNELFKQKKYAEAIEQYTFAVECDPNNHTYYTNRAACYATMGEWEKCLRDAERSIQKKSDWVKGWFRKGQALFELHRYQEAYEAYKMAYSFDAKDDFKEKMLESEKMWKKDMSPAQLLKEEGNAFFKIGKIPDALVKYEAGIKALKPDEISLKAQLYNNVAHCQVQLYDPKKVIAACDEVLAIEPFNTKALLRRATAYESTEKIRAALNDFEKVILVDPASQLAQKGASRTRASLRSQGKDL